MEKIVSLPRSTWRGFMSFLREQGVAGLAIGFILGGAVSKVVGSLVNDLINPVLAIFIGAKDGLVKESYILGGQKIMWGSFVATTIDFLVVAFVVYFGIKIIGLNRLDKNADQGESDETS